MRAEFSNGHSQEIWTSFDPCDLAQLGLTPCERGLQSVCLSLSLSLFSRVVSVRLCLSLCVRVCRLSLFFCVFLCFSVYFRVSVSVYLGNVCLYLSLSLSSCLFVFVSANRFMAHFRVVILYAVFPSFKHCNVVLILFCFCF